MSEHPARIVGDRILCGHIAGGNRCRGVVGYMDLRAQAHPLPGTVEDPPGSGSFRWSARARRRMTAEGRAAVGQPRQAGGWFGKTPKKYRGLTTQVPDLPWTFPCDICGQLAIVHLGVLSS